MSKYGKVAAIIEARMTSTRLPGKVILDIGGKPVLQRIVEKLKKNEHIDDVIVATTINNTDDAIVDLCDSINCKVFRGSENDVLSRVLDAALENKVDVIVEITGDCPFVDNEIINELFKVFENNNYDYVSNTVNRTFPDGFDVQIFKTEALKKTEKSTNCPVDREHVSLYIYSNPHIFSIYNWDAPEKFFHPEIEVTLDTIEDYKLITRVHDSLVKTKPDYGISEIIEFLLNNKEVARINEKTERNDPYEQKRKLENNA